MAAQNPKGYGVPPHPADRALDGRAEIYRRFLGPRSAEPLRLLALGIGNGASLRRLASYLPAARIVALDVIAGPVDLLPANVEFLRCDPADEELLREAAGRFPAGKIDVVVDDASHILDRQVQAFETLFPLLDEGGLYFVEEIGPSRFNHGNRRVLPFLDFLDYSWNLARQTTFFADDRISTRHTIADTGHLPPFELELAVPTDWNRNLGGVYYFHNLCVFEKRSRRIDLPVAAEGAGLRPEPGLHYQVRRLGFRTETPSAAVPETSLLRAAFHAIVESVSAEPAPLDEAARDRLALSLRDFGSAFHALLDEFAVSKLSLRRIEKVANQAENERAALCHELALLTSAHTALSADLARSSANLDAARRKIKEVWDFIFRMKAERASEAAEWTAERASLQARLAQVREEAAALQLQNNASRIAAAETSLLESRFPLALAHLRRALALAESERDRARVQIVELFNAQQEAPPTAAQDWQE